METIIGLGKAGCAVAREFAKYPQYEVYLIDTTPSSEDNFFHLTPQKSHEDYEANCPSFEEFFKDIDKSCLFVVGGGSKISGASLAVLSHLREHETSVLYLHPDEDELIGTTLLQHNVVFGVLQEYTRSSLFKRMYIVQKSKIEETLQDLPVIGYYDKINECLVSTIHMTNVFSNTDSEFDTFREIDAAASISTFGIFNLDTDEEMLYYDIKLPRERRYYFAINRETLQTDGKLLKDIKEKIKNRIDGMTKISYGIFSTNYDANYGYCGYYSSLIQTEGDEE